MSPLSGIEVTGIKAKNEGLDPGREGGCREGGLLLNLDPGWEVEVEARVLEVEKEASSSEIEVKEAFF